MRRVNPQNIDGVADELRKLDTPDQPLVVRLSISVNLEALRVRRDQYVRCGVLEANVDVHTSATGSEASTQVEGCSYAGKSNSERVADCGVTPCVCPAWAQS